MRQSTIDPAYLERQRKRDAVRDQMLKADFKMLMADVRFRRFIGMMLDSFSPFKGTPSYNGSENYYLDGRADAGKWVLDLIARSCEPAQFTEVLIDWRKREQGKPLEDGEENG